MIINSLLKILPFFFLTLGLVPTISEAQSRSSLIASDTVGITQVGNSFIAANSRIGLEVDADLNDTVNASTSAEANTTVNTSSSSNVNGSTTTTNDNSVDTMNGSTTVNGSASTSLFERFTNIINPIASGTVELQTNAFSVEVASSNQVGTEEDLQIFNENLTQMYTNIQKVETNTDNNGASTIEITYKHPGRFLGIIPVNFSTITTVTTNEDGTLSVNSRLSLLSYLVSDKLFDKARIESRISNNPIVIENSQVNSTPSQKARVTEALVAELNLNEAEMMNLQQSTSGSFNY